MKSSEHIETEQLLAEIGRYLTAVELFRTLDCEPHWRPETAQSAATPAPQPARPWGVPHPAH